MEGHSVALILTAATRASRTLADPECQRGDRAPAHRGLRVCLGTFTTKPPLNPEATGSLRFRPLLARQSPRFCTRCLVEAM